MQTEWNGLEKYLKVYYVEEIVPKLASDPITYILQTEELQKQEVTYIKYEETDIEFTQTIGIEYLNINEFI
jgi:hypothetical protein